MGFEERPFHHIGSNPCWEEEWAVVLLDTHGLHQPSGENEVACQSERALRSMGQPSHLYHNWTTGFVSGASP